jgi:apolipoprotein D and lipocalin family protein
MTGTSVTERALVWHVDNTGACDDRRTAMTRPFRLTAAAFSLVLGACSNDPPLEVASVDLAAFQGPWYEIAKLAPPAGARCTGTTFNYRLTGDAELEVVVDCREGSLAGPLHRIEAIAVAADPRVPARLTLESEWFHGNHWIVEVDPDYTLAAIGEPSRRRLSILSRLPGRSNAKFSELGERLEKKGFDLSRLERTLQPAGTGAEDDAALRVTSRFRDTPP